MVAIMISMLKIVKKCDYSFLVFFNWQIEQIIKVIDEKDDREGFKDIG